MSHLLREHAPITEESWARIEAWYAAHAHPLTAALAPGASAAAIKSFEAPYQCDCYFDSLTKGTSACQKCAGPQECPSARPACNYGFCEVR